MFQINEVIALWKTVRRTGAAFEACLFQRLCAFAMCLVNQNTAFSPESLPAKAWKYTCWGGRVWGKSRRKWLGGVAVHPWFKEGHRFSSFAGTGWNKSHHGDHACHRLTFAVLARWRGATWSRGLEFCRDMMVGWSLPRFECKRCWWCRRLLLFCVCTHALIIPQGSGLGLAGPSKANVPERLACRSGVWSLPRTPLSNQRNCKIRVWVLKISLCLWYLMLGLLI